MNNVTLVGNLTDVPDLHKEDGKTARATFTVAVNERYRDGNGEWQQSKPVFVPCVAWGRAAENIFESATKGDRLAVQGSLSVRRVNDKTYTEVVVESAALSLDFSTARVAEKVEV